jgi:hypothetical protein
VGRVLLLNATFEPLQLVSERRAVVLMLAGRAEPIVTPDEPMVCRSAMLIVEIPAIVRLHEMVKVPTKVRTPPLTRRSLFSETAISVRTAWSTRTRLTTWCPGAGAVATSGPTSWRPAGVTTCKRVIDFSRSWAGDCILNPARLMGPGGGGATCPTRTPCGRRSCLAPRELGGG